jgi:tetratricopeptide (TPR) repeat protein
MMRSLGVALGYFGYHEMARYYIDEALKLDNDSIIYLNNLAFLEYYENPRKAIELFSEVLKRDTSNLNALWNEMVLYERLGSYKEALRIAVITIKLYQARNMSLQSGLEYIGYAFLKTGDYNGAKIYFDKQISISEKILKLDPLANNPKLVLARVYATLGKKEHALQLLTDIQKQGRENRSKEGSIMPQGYFYQLKYEPMYENLLSEPMFQNYINEVESNCKEDFEKLNLWMKNKGVLKE